MAYSAISDAELGVNKPMTSSLWFRIRDNPLAIFSQMGWGVSASVYLSPNQTITSSGTLTLTHGLSVSAATDIDVTAYLKCTTAEFGYSINDVITVSNAPDIDTGSAIATGQKIEITTTAINIRFSNQTGVYKTISEASGGYVNLTNGSWALIIKARG